MIRKVVCGVFEENIGQGGECSWLIYYNLLKLDDMVDSCHIYKSLTTGICLELSRQNISDGRVPEALGSVKDFAVATFLFAVVLTSVFFVGLNVATLARAWVSFLIRHVGVYVYGYPVVAFLLSVTSGMCLFRGLYSLFKRLYASTMGRLDKKLKRVWYDWQRFAGSSEFGSYEKDKLNRKKIQLCYFTFLVVSFIVSMGLNILGITWYGYWQCMEGYRHTLGFWHMLSGYVSINLLIYCSFTCFFRDFFLSSYNQILSLGVRLITSGYRPATVTITHDYDKTHAVGVEKNSLSGNGENMYLEREGDEDLASQDSEDENHGLDIAHYPTELSSRLASGEVTPLHVLSPRAQFLSLESESHTNKPE